MGIGNRLQELGRFLDECERRGEAIDDVDVATITGVEADRLTADLEVTLSIDPTADGAALRDPRVGSDGTVRFALASTTALTPTTDHDVSTRPTGADLRPDGTLTVTLAATVPADRSRAAEPDPDVEADADDGTAGGAAAADADPAEATETALSAVAGAETAAADGPAAAGASAATSPDDARATPTDVRTESDGRETAATFTSDRDVPPFKDPELLAEVYEACETFAEMADALEMDVTGETVRRYMIDYDIHEPNTYRTGDAADDGDDQEDDVGSSTDPSRASDRATPETDRPAPGTESADVDHPSPSADVDHPSPSADVDHSTRSVDADEPVVLSDGIGLPEDVTVDALIETVMRSNTIYEVKRDVDVDREDALELLKELNLLEFVVGQLATEGERETTREDIIACLRESAAAR
ncbi:hypothetical protein [Halopenitus persicus]|uniref:hypothetical protein n=1 Tax=Halopenitus persicus TaxID=1048396 RepID=UPI000BBB541D|nr:hypothetical protein [Halopenitus persicus]